MKLELSTINYSSSSFSKILSSSIIYSSPSVTFLLSLLTLNVFGVIVSFLLFLGVISDIINENLLKTPPLRAVLADVGLPDFFKSTDLKT